MSCRVRLLTLCAALLLVAPVTWPDPSCCVKAIALGKDCAHKCCTDAAKLKKVCEKCNPKKAAKN